MSEIRLLAVGDISLVQKSEISPFAGISSTLKNKDVLFGNLETSLTDLDIRAQKAVVLSAPTWKAKYLSDAGFDIVNIANNHIADGGHEGLSQTHTSLSGAGIKAIGFRDNTWPQKPAIITKNGISIGFLGYDQYGIQAKDTSLIIDKIDENKVIGDIIAAKRECNIVMVSLHWGMEYSNYPSPKQIELARSFIDAGAAVVLGHHPHVPQGIEIYKSGLIAYSLGNFQFDIKADSPRCGMDRNRSFIISILLGHEGFLSFDIVPITIDQNCMPVIANYEEGLEIAEFLRQISAPLTANSINWKWWYSQISENYLRDSMKSWKTRIRNYGAGHFFDFLKWLLRPFVWRCFWSTMIGKSIFKSSIVEKSDASIQTNLSNDEVEREANVSR